MSHCSDFNCPEWGRYESSLRVKAEILARMPVWKEVFCFTSDSFTFGAAVYSGFSKHILWIVASFYLF